MQAEGQAVPHEQMNEQQVAAYVHMDAREIHKLCCRGQIPCRKVAGRFVFTKEEVDHWLEAQMHRIDKERLAGIEKAVSEHHGLEDEHLMVEELIPRGGIAVPLEARTRDAAIRALVDIADGAGAVCSREKLIEAVRNREALCTTALFPGTAIPHPRRALPHDIVRSFVVVGLASSGIPYGAEDGSLTRLFFMVCCKDERTHLHVLARLARMLHGHQAVDRLTACTDAAQLRRTLLELERTALAG